MNDGIVLPTYVDRLSCLTDPVQRAPRYTEECSDSFSVQPSPATTQYNFRLPHVRRPVATTD